MYEHSLLLHAGRALLPVCLAKHPPCLPCTGIKGSLACLDKKSGQLSESGGCVSLFASLSGSVQNTLLCLAR
jgi:hypothetical protein